MGSDQLRSLEISAWEKKATNPVPAGATVRLEFDRREYYLGENVLAHFTLENTGEKPFHASFGQDSGQSGRSLRFKVTATDETGQMAEDPDPSEAVSSWNGGPVELKPGAKYVRSLALMRYCDIGQ